jgi:hypothetical protein
MDLIQVDVIGAQPLEGRIARLADVRRVEREAAAPAETDFGRNEHFVAATVERFGDELLRVPAPVRVGRIHPVHAEIERASQRVDDLAIFRARPHVAPRRPGAEADDRDRRAVPSEVAVSHAPSLPARMRRIHPAAAVACAPCGTSSSPASPRDLPIRSRPSSGS